MSGLTTLNMLLDIFSTAHPHATSSNIPQRTPFRLTSSSRTIHQHTIEHHIATRAIQSHRKTHYIPLNFIEPRNTVPTTPPHISVQFTPHHRTNHHMLLQPIVPQQPKAHHPSSSNTACHTITPHKSTHLNSLHVTEPLNSFQIPDLPHQPIPRNIIEHSTATEFHTIELPKQLHSQLTKTKIPTTKHSTPTACITWSLPTSAPSWTPRWLMSSGTTAARMSSTSSKSFRL